MSPQAYIYRGCCPSAQSTGALGGLSQEREEEMRRTVVSVLALGVVMALATAAMANGPAERITEDVTGDQIICEDATYTVTSGEIRIVTHEGAAAQGNQNFTFTLTPLKVVAEDEFGNVVSLAGAFWGGGAFNANTLGEVFTFTGKLQLVSKGGGSVGSVNVTFHVTAQPNNFVLKEFNFGTCQEPTD